MSQSIHEKVSTWQLKKTFFLSGMSARVGTLTCRHIPMCWHLFRCWHMSVHISIQIKKVHMISIRDIGTCQHLDVPACVGTFQGVGTFSGADTCQHILVTSQFANKKVHMISIRDVGMCRHIPMCWHLFRYWHMSVHISIQIKKVHMISIRDVGT